MLKVRNMYCPSHFGNSYECASKNEMREILSEAKFWGLNCYSDWFDTIDLYDPYAREKNGISLFNMPEAMWERKFSHYRTAHDLGFELGLAIAPNHVFSDQLTLGKQAVKTENIFGQLLCPSDPVSHEVILKNYKNLFNDFKSHGLNLKSLEANPYDYGGCACEKCSPWITAFAELYKNIFEMAKTFFPEIKANMICWWVSEEEHEILDGWLAKNASNLLNSKIHYIPYGRTSYDITKYTINEKYGERAFVHVGYGGGRNSDLYGHFGPVAAPKRIEETVKFLETRKAEGFSAYCEGTFEDLNRAILAGLGSGAYSDANSVMKAYAERYFGTNPEGWAHWLAKWENAFEVNVKESRTEFDLLSAGAKRSWRLEQWECKLKMFEFGHVATKSKDRKAAADFWDEKEYLWRKVWGLGLTRHILKFDWRIPPWEQEDETANRRTGLDQ